MFPNQTERCPFCNSETCSRKPVIGMHSRSEECFNRQIALLKSALHDLKAENERLKAEVERQRKEINDACASLTMISLCATDGTNLITLVDAANDTAGDLHQQLATANVKIVELRKQLATARHDLERIREDIKKLCDKWKEDERRERKNFHFAQAQDTLAMRNQLAAILNEKGAE